MATDGKSMRMETSAKEKINRELQYEILRCCLTNMIFALQLQQNVLF